MNILIINSGSSSIKFQFIRMPAEEVVCTGMVERIGNPDAIVNFRMGKFHSEQVMAVNSHIDGLEKITALLLDAENGPIEQPGEIDAIGHRVVHGGNTFSNTSFIDEEVKQKIEHYSVMAPLHNPHNLKGITVTEKLFPEARQVAVFDTAFHQTIPIHAHKFAIPNSYYSQHELKVYGFHGTSHAFVVKRAKEFLSKDIEKIISVHLGNGCSITAVRNGESVDTSLGFGPSNGLIMGTRSGDIDHSLIFYLAKTLGYSLDEIKTLLDKKSGMLGLTGYSDLREIESSSQKGDKDSTLALHMNAYRIKKYIGAYTAVMNGLDTLIFTAGIGENSSLLRGLVCKDMEALGIGLNREKNLLKSLDPRAIDSGDLSVRVLVIPTNEELEIARQAYGLVQTENSQK